MLAERATAVAALLTGWSGAIDFMHADPREAARRMGIRQQIDAEQFLEAQRGLTCRRGPRTWRCSAAIARAGHQRAAPDDADAGVQAAGAPVDIERLFAPAPLAKLPPERAPT